MGFDTKSVLRTGYQLNREQKCFDTGVLNGEPRYFRVFFKKTVVFLGEYKYNLG